MSFYTRSKDEVLEAFSEGSPVTAAGLALVSQEIIIVPCEFLRELKLAKPQEKGKSKH